MKDEYRSLLMDLLGFEAGLCDPETEARIRQRLQDPNSEESRGLREINRIEQSFLSPQSLAISEALVKERLAADSADNQLRRANVQSEDLQRPMPEANEPKGEADQAPQPPPTAEHASEDPNVWKSRVKRGDQNREVGD